MSTRKTPSGAQLVRELGAAGGARLVIVKCDDLGSSPAANNAIVEALACEAATSASLMVPCADAAAGAAASITYDVGVHLTLNSEWERPRWEPLTSGRTLRDADGCLHRTPNATVANADIAEVRAECRAQIQHAVEMGVDVSHLDSHMGTIFFRDDFTDVYLDLAREFDVPLRISEPGHARAVLGIPVRARARALRRRLARLRRRARHAGILVPDHADALHVVVPAGDDAGVVPEHGTLAAVAGVNEVFVHPAADSSEFRATNPQWRRRVAEHALLVSGRLTEAIRAEDGLDAIGYRALRDLQRRLGAVR